MATRISEDTEVNMEREGSTRLAFANIEEREVAWRIIETWYGMVKTLREMGEHLVENGEALKEYGGFDWLEGRARIHAGMEITSLAEIVVMEAQSDERGMAADTASRLLEKFKKIDKAIETEDPELFKEWREEFPPRDPVKVRSEAEARLVKLRENLDYLERQPCVKKNVEEWYDLVRNIRQCERTISVQVSAEEYEKHAEKPDPVAEEEINLKVRVLAHEGNLVMVPLAPEEGIDDDWWPTGGDKMGCVVGDTRRRLGVSKEAIGLMRGIKRNRDAIGDIGWWRCHDGTYAFSWWGPIFRIIHPNDAEGSRDFATHPDQYVEIPNDVPPEVIEGCRKAAAGEMLLSGKAAETMWKMPFKIEPNPYEDESSKESSDVYPEG